MKPRTAAQDAAVIRNWRIRSLRALQELCRVLGPERWPRARDIIDEALVEVGAKTWAEHYVQVGEEWQSAAPNGARTRRYRFENHQPAE